MVCEHLRHLYQLCITQQIRLSSSELVHFVCRQCDTQDTCPSNLMEYDEHLHRYEIGAENGTAPDRSTAASKGASASERT
jgi:hypothetical protein